MALQGMVGKIVIGAADVASIKNWKLNASKAMIDTSAFGGTWETKITGLGAWTANSEGQWAADTDTNGQTSLQTAFLAGTSITLKLYVSAAHYYSGTAYISKMDTSDAVDGIVTVTFEFTGSGAVTYT